MKKEKINKKGLRGIAVLLLFFPLLLVSLNTDLSKDQHSFDFESLSCTSILVGRLASVDGSTMTSHTCDGPYRNWVEIVPAKEYGPDAKDSVYTGLHWTETPADKKGMKLAGSIPQGEKTYAFLNTSYPAMNEYQLAMGETTIMANPKLKSSKGIFYIEELQRIALQRTKTAREAIKLMGKLIKKYGYKDGAECLTIIDPKEVWQFEVFGPGSGNLGGVWAAARIPDGHIGVSANYPRIGEIDLKKPDFFMASDNIYSLAKKLKLWDPKSKKPFKVRNIYTDPKPYTKSMYEKYCKLREWWVLNSLSPSSKIKFDSEFPFSVKPDKKVSVQEVMGLFRTNYAGSEYDMTKNLGKKSQSGRVLKNPAANPWMTRNMMRLFSDLKPGAVEMQRMIAINGCAYSTVIQSRSWLPDSIGGITWLAFDNPALAARIPVFAGTKKLLKELSISNQKRFRRDSAAWAFRRAARLAQPLWKKNKKIVNKTIREFEEKALAELPDLEKRVVEMLKTDKSRALEMITSYVNNFSRAVIHKYWDLGDQFWSLYSGGFRP